MTNAPQGDALKTGDAHTPRATGIEGVLLDMDGVVTDTAEAHAAAWKRLFDEFLAARASESGEAFRPFDLDRDYREYVDGKPRYDGIRSFLASRDIALPYGSDDDGPDRQTVCGLGNRKNRYFRAWLNDNRVRTFPGTLALIHALRTAGIKVAVFSASRNAEAVLRNAGALDLFDAKVDGADISRLGLPGKPDPAMLLAAAARLGVAPERAAVVEDALAGVEAGKRGGFGLVVGVDRARQANALRHAGAGLVVGDLAELRLTQGHDLVRKTLSNLPSFLDRKEEIRSHLAGREPIVFLDYDGTLTPIVEDYTKAFMSREMRVAVAALARRCTVAIVSGRDVGVVRDLVRLETVYYAGSHGFDIEGPQGWSEHLQKGVEFLPGLDQVERALRDRLRGIDGHAVERKRFSIAVHYRRASDENAKRIEAAVDDVLSSHPRLAKAEGKKVFRVQPRIDWNKGQAVLWLIARLGPDRGDAVPVYAGDDITDEDAFRALAGRGLSLVVRDPEDRPTAADYALADPDDVRGFVEFLTALLDEGDARSPASR